MGHHFYYSILLLEMTRLIDNPTLPISLVIVSDFEPGKKTWQDEDACLRHSMADPNGVPSQVIIAASAAYEQTERPDWSDISVPVEIIFVDSEYSGTIKDGATDHATQDLLAVVEADCIAKPRWLLGLYVRYLEDMDVGAVSGLTMYEPTSVFRRVSSLYDRAFIEETFHNGDAIHISNNGALYEKDLLSRFPYPEDTSPFISAHKRSISIIDAEIRCSLTKEAIQYHAFDGWSFIVDVRKNKGFQYQIMRSEMMGVSPNALQKIWWTIDMALKGILSDYRTLKRSFSTFCKPRDLPLALLYPFLVRPLELWGAVLCHMGHRSVPHSSYR